MRRQLVRWTIAGDNSSVAIWLKFGSTVRVTCKFVDHGCPSGSRCEPITRTICVLGFGVGREGGCWAVGSVVPYTFDHPNRRLIFVKVSSSKDLAAEPFLDRGIRKLVTDLWYALPFDVGLEYALGCNNPAADPPRRCGSTFPHLALSAVGACSVSELTGLAGSSHLGIPNLGGRGQMRRTSSS